MERTRVVQLAPVRGDDLADVGAFLHARLDSGLSPEQWAASVVPTWPVSSPNHGFLLRAEGRVVGVQLAFYSEREIDGVIEGFCNLGAWCVEEEHRAQGLRMLRAALAQPGYHFTDLSPSGNVVGLNERLRFRRLDTTTALALNLPLPQVRTRVVSDHDEIESLLDGAELQIFRDHRRAAAAHHVVLRRGDDLCYVVFRSDRRKGRRLFASLLHVSDPTVLARCRSALGRHLLLRHRLPFTLAELRVVGARPPLSHLLAHPRPKMLRSDRLGEAHVDSLYSELALVAY